MSRFRLAAALVALVGCGGGELPAKCAAEPTPTVVRCSYVADTREGARCLSVISAEVAAKRWLSDVLQVAGGRVLRLERVDGLGNPVDSEGVSRSEFTFAADHLVSERQFSSNGRLVALRNFSEDGTRIERRDAAGAFVVEPATGAVITLRTFDAAGLVLTERYLEADGKTPVSSIPAEVRFTRDEHGFIASKAWFDGAGQPVVTRRGASEVDERNALGNLVAERFGDERGGPAYDEHHVHTRRRIFDPSGNLIEERYLDLIVPTTLAGTDVHRIRYRLDEHGRMVHSAAFGLHDQHVANSDGLAQTEVTYDLKGRVASERFFDVSGAPIEKPRHAKVIERFYDDRSRVVRRRYTFSDHVLIHQITVDERDLEIEVHCFDEHGAAQICGRGTAVGWRNAFDPRRRLSERTFVDANGALAIGDDGEAVFRTLYDARGKSSHEYFDAAGHSIDVEKFGAKHLVVSYKTAPHAIAGANRTRDEAKRRADEALAKIKSGTPFEDVVAIYSDETGSKIKGGDLGHFKLGVMVKPFEEALIRLEPGQTSDIVETDFGFHIIVRTQ